MFDVLTRHFAAHLRSCSLHMPFWWACFKPQIKPSKRISRWHSFLRPKDSESMSYSLSSGREGAKETQVSIFPLKWGANEIQWAIKSFSISVLCRCSLNTQLHVVRHIQWEKCMNTSSMIFTAYVTCPRDVFVAFLVDHSQEAVENYEQSQNQAPNEFAAVISQL